MRLVRFLCNGQIQLGQQLDDQTALRIEGDTLGPHMVSNHKLHIEKLLAPLIPCDILAIGANYRDHAAETGMAVGPVPLLFIKGGNTLNNPLDPIPIPRLSTQIDYEGELAVVIGKAAKNVSRQTALDYVLGYTIANDVSARDWQRDKALGGGQFARGKSFDGFCPLGPALVTADEIPNPNNLRLRTLLNGQVMQDSSTSQMTFDVPTIIESLSSTMTLRPGTLILTGTPAGVGMSRKPPVWLKPGDTVAVEIDGLGRLENPVSREI